MEEKEKSAEEKTAAERRYVERERARIDALHACANILHGLGGDDGLDDRLFVMQGLEAILYLAQTPFQKMTDQFNEKAPDLLLSIAERYVSYVMGGLAPVATAQPAPDGVLIGVAGSKSDRILAMLRVARLSSDELIKVAQGISDMTSEKS